MDQMIRELRELTDQIRREHDPARLQAALAEAVRTPPAGPARQAAAWSVDEGPTRDLKQLLARPAQSPAEAELQRLNDRVYLCSRLLRRDPRGLKCYRDLAASASALSKALATTDDDFIPDGFSVSLVEEVRLQRRVPGLFEAVALPRSPLKWPVEGSIGLPYLVGENVHDTAAKVPTRTPGTRSVTFAAKTIGVRVPFSHEFDEDSIVAAEEYVRRQIAKALTDGLETAILNGDPGATHFDAVVTADNDVRRSFAGLRRLARNPAVATETDLATFSQTTWSQAREKMGVYGIDPSELVCLLSVKSYYRILGDATGWGDFQTLDKVGPQAINVTGEVGALYGVPVVVSAYLPETCDGSATDDGTGTDAVMLLVNRRAYGLATQVGPTIETVWDAEALQFKVIGYQRLDFQPWFDAASQPAVSVGYNIGVA